MGNYYSSNSYIITHEVSLEEKIKRDNEIEDQIRLLKTEGHVCIVILSSFPRQIQWCNHERCSHNDWSTTT